MISNVVSQKDKTALVVVVLATLLVPTALILLVQLSHSGGSDEVLGDNVEISDGLSSDNSNNLGYDQTMEKPTILEDKKIKNKKSIIKTEKGDIVIELYADDAPLTVSNHVNLVESGFYNGLTFHRREEGFVIQGGDPNGNGTGGPGYKFEDEPVTREYNKGIVAMANSGPNTNGSQFFIMLEDYPLPPLYTIFGKVIEGQDIVDQIAIGDKMISVEIQDI